MQHILYLEARTRHRLTWVGLLEWGPLRAPACTCRGSWSQKPSADGPSSLHRPHLHPLLPLLQGTQIQPPDLQLQPWSGPQSTVQRHPTANREKQQLLDLCYISLFKKKPNTPKSTPFSPSGNSSLDQHPTLSPSLAIELRLTVRRRAPEGPGGAA